MIMKFIKQIMSAFMAFVLALSPLTTSYAEDWNYSGVENSEDIGIDDNVLESYDSQISTFATDVSPTLEYVTTINGYGYTAAVAHSGSNKYWSTSYGSNSSINSHLLQGERPEGLSSSFGSSSSQTVPLFNTTYFTKGNILKFRLYGASCSHSPCSATVYVNNVAVASLYVNSGGGGGNNIKYYHINSSGYYSASAIGYAYQCEVSSGHGICILPTYEIYRYRYPITYDLEGDTIPTNLPSLPASLNKPAVVATPGNPNYYYEETETFSLINPTKEGHTFIGWTGTDLNGNTMTVTIPQWSEGVRQYTAHWQRNKYPVTIIDVLLNEDGTPSNIELGRNTIEDTYYYGDYPLFFF